MPGPRPWSTACSPGLTAFAAARRRRGRRRDRCSPPTPRARWPRAPCSRPRRSSIARWSKPAQLRRTAACCCSPAAPRPACSAYLKSPARLVPGPRAARSRGVPRGGPGQPDCQQGHLLHSRLACVQPYSFSYWPTSRSSRGRTGLRRSEAQLPVSPKVECAAAAARRARRRAAAANGSCVTVGPFCHQRTRRARAADARSTAATRRFRAKSTPACSTVTGSISKPADRIRRAPSARSPEEGRRRRCGRHRRPRLARRISLGVFSDEARAAAQSERVAKLQLLPQIEAREKPGTAIWLDLTLKSDAPPLEGQKFPAGDAELEFRACPAPVSRGAGAGIGDRRDSAGRAARLKSAPSRKAGLAQLVEHLICNQGVAGSIPAAGTKSCPTNKSHPSWAGGDLRGRTS